MERNKQEEENQKYEQYKYLVIISVKLTNMLNYYLLVPAVKWSISNESIRLHHSYEEFTQQMRNAYDIFDS